MTTNTLIHILAFTVFLIIIIAIFASVKYHPEKYDNGNLYIVSKRIKYLDYGLINYFSQPSQITRIKEGDSGNNGSPYVFIYPNNIDIMCSATTIKDDFVCSDISITKSFVTDNAPIYMNEKTSGVITNNAKQDNEQNYTMRIFNNEYKLKKRAIVLDIESIEPFQNTTSQNALWYQIKVKGNLSTFVLTRPVFISVNELGAYKVIYSKVPKNEKETNMFVSFNSNDKLHTFYVEKINDQYAFPFTTKELHDKVINNEKIRNVNNTTPLNLYYPVFERTLPFVNFDVNSFTLHLSKDSLEKYNIIPQFASITGNNETPSSDKIQSIQLVKNESNKLLYTIHITHPSITFKINLPSDFVPQKFVQYDIIIIYSFDIMIVTCLGRDASNNEYCFVDRYATDKYNMIFETKKSKLESQIGSLRNDVPHTSIQHLPLLAFKYGYTFPN